MGQYWKIINLDTKEAHGLHKIGPETFYGRYDWLLRTVTQPLRPSAVTTATFPNTSLGALALPTDIILMIFHELEDWVDAMCLCVAHPILEVIGSPHADALGLAWQAPWIGHRLVCVGDYARTDDLPDGMLTEEETQELRTGDADSDYRPTLYGADYKSVYLYEVHRVIGYWDMNSRDRAKLRELFDPSYDNDEWVLCNLSKQEFVLSRTIKDFTGDNTKGLFGTTQIGLGTVLLSRICWSSDEGGTTYYDDEDLHIHRGAWAGDRFRVTSVEKFEETENRADWADVGAQVVAVIAAICRYNIGKDWRNTI
ncbi:hypothetical protein FA95DRAFT_1563843 [Auriscalpium vulgare]|uniref:Uncharacterized protein n=1 Tax=Auriscalpium vulgare TaxID=40419 RepID=A0ACB8RFN9_9AGAM|nr:hypothetical protein FA95DRAFT_1563843 [Auriscalpium vulgare]